MSCGSQISLLTNEAVSLCLAQPALALHNVVVLHMLHIPGNAPGLCPSMTHILWRAPLAPCFLLGATSVVTSYDSALFHEARACNGLRPAYIHMRPVRSFRIMLYYCGGCLI